MKRIFILAAALAPFVALAQGGASTAEIDKASLRHDLSVKKIIGSEVQSRDGKEVGEVEEVIFDSQGEVVSVLVEVDDDIEKGGGLDTSAEAGPEAAGDTQPGAARLGADQDRELAEIRFSDANFQPEQEVVQVEMDSTQIAQAPRRSDDAADATASGQIKASELIGMEVDLADEESFGEVEDVLISRDDGKPTAFVVDSMDFLNKQRYALPARVDAVNKEENVVRYDDVSLQQVEQMGEFETDDDEGL